MKLHFSKIKQKPKLFEQSKDTIWENSYISKGMLKAHLDENLQSATRKIETVKQTVDWIAKQAPPLTHPKLLDLGCGPGIYTELFHDKGYCVTGMDFSARSIAYAKQSALHNNVYITYILEDYTKVAFAQDYNLITLIYCDLGVLATNVRKTLLTKIFQSLAPDGFFIFDVFKPVKYKGIKETRCWDVDEDHFWSPDACLVLSSFYRYDEENTYLNQYMIINEKEKMTTYNVWEHTFSLEELKQDLEQAGFKSFKFYGNLSGAKQKASDETIGIIAQKK